MHLLLGIHHTLVWNGVFQHNRGWLLQILLRGRLRGIQCWRMWRVHGIFNLFEVDNLGAMVSIITMLTTKSAREVLLKRVVVFPPLAFVFIFPLGVLVTLVLVSPSRLVLLGINPP
jgi:hypothetical protein